MFAILKIDAEIKIGKQFLLVLLDAKLVFKYIKKNVYLLITLTNNDQ